MGSSRGLGLFYQIPLVAQCHDREIGAIAPAGLVDRRTRMIAQRGSADRGVRKVDEQLTATAAQSERPVVVVAEDDRAQRALLIKQLTKAGHVVCGHENGQLAFDDIRQRRDVIVIADWEMPELTGIQLCEAVREIQQMGVIRSAHIIILTAMNTKERIVAGLAAGADDYLTKPYCAEELLARVGAGERTLVLQNELHQQRLVVQKVNAELNLLNQHLEHLASRDALTGLYNRRMLFEFFETCWEDCAKRDQPIGCIMLDIDHFKSINDEHGHAVGDLTLTRVARTICESHHPSDYCGRIGGEEFMVVCPSQPAAAVQQTASRIRAAIAGTPIPHDGGQLEVTASIGVAPRGPQHASLERLSAAADELAYAAKRNGRNQVWSLDASGQPYCHSAGVALTR